MKNLAKWLVVLTGVYDLLIGVGVLATASPADPRQKATWALTLMLAGFLLFVGAVLIWAAQDLEARGALVFWQALLRLWAAFVLLKGIAGNFYPAGETDVPRVAAIIDIAVAVFYLAALFAIWRHSPIRLLLGRSRSAPAGA